MKNMVLLPLYCQMTRAFNASHRASAHKQDQLREQQLSVGMLKPSLEQHSTANLSLAVNYLSFHMLPLVALKCTSAEGGACVTGKRSG